MCEPGVGKIALKGTPLVTGPVTHKQGFVFGKPILSITKAFVPPIHVHIWWYLNRTFVDLAVR